MKNVSTKIIALALLGAAGCTTPSQVTMLPGVGPSPAPAVPNSGAGFLQVYTARERVPMNINGETFDWNNDYGQNDFLYRAAHTGYSVTSQTGQLLVQVPNATGMNDATPTRLQLSPGDYQIRAEAANTDGVNSSVIVPVCIEAGKTTLVRLDGQWHIWTKGPDDQWVRLANGSVVGWHCSDSEKADLALQTSN